MSQRTPSAWVKLIFSGTLLIAREAHIIRHPAHRARVLGHSVYVAGEMAASAGTAFRSGWGKGGFCRPVRPAEWPAGDRRVELFQTLSINSPAHCLVVPQNQRLKCE